MLAVLADAGADLDAPSGSNHENSPLGWAIVSGAEHAVRYLLERGATVARWHPKDAEAGVRGEYRRFSAATPEARRRIRDAVLQRV